MFDLDPEQRLPVTLLTGFLGSGKTSLLNRWLRDDSLADAAVIVNELGEIGIDHALIASSNENTIELSTGCLCCTISGDLVDTLRDLYVKRSAGEIRPFSRVIIETTGMADPGPVIQVLMSQPATTRYRLCGIVATIDAVHGQQTLDGHIESVKQIAVADHIVMTKADLVAKPSIDALSARMLQLAPTATLRQSTLESWPAPAQLLTQQAYFPSSSSAAVSLASRETTIAAPEEGEANRYRRYRRAGGSVHDARIESFVLYFEDSFEWEHLAAWLDALTIAHPNQLLRVKGIFAIEGRPLPLAVHAVQSLFHPPTELAEWPDLDHRSRVVFITQDLSRSYVEEVLSVIRSRSPRPPQSPSSMDQ